MPLFDTDQSVIGTPTTQIPSESTRTIPRTTDATVDAWDSDSHYSTFLLPAKHSPLYRRTLVYPAGSQYISPSPCFPGDLWVSLRNTLRLAVPRALPRHPTGQSKCPRTDSTASTLPTTRLHVRPLSAEHSVVETAQSGASGRRTAPMVPICIQPASTRWAMAKRRATASFLRLSQPRE